MPMSLLPTEKRLFLLDGMALMYRAHFALMRSPRFTSGDVCTSAVFGMTNTILDIINKQEPTHLVAAFDTPEPTHRHKEFPEYKAQRDALPEDIAAQFPLVDRLLDALNIPVIRKPGFEADDIIGTLAYQAAEEGFQAFMVTPDKDFTQLVGPNVRIYRPGRGGAQFELLGVPEVLEKWQIERVDQVVDILGLMGDASDNIPGVPGVGEKTAQKLIARYGSIENLLQHTHELKGKQKERVEENRDQALLSKRLVQIVTDVPHDTLLDSLAWSAYDKDKLKALLMELEFETLGKRLFGKSFSAAPTRARVARKQREDAIQARLFDEPVEEKTIHDVSHDYHTVTTPEQRDALIAALQQQRAFCFDLETTSLDPHRAIPLGIAFSWQAHSASYVVLPEDPQALADVLESFRPVLENPSIEKIGHNLKYDASVLRWHGLFVKGPLFDTMLGHSMKEPEMRHGLDYLAKLYLGYQPISTESLIGEKGNKAQPQRSMRDVPLGQLAEYACEDADVTWQIASVLRPEIASEGAEEVCFQVECPLIPALVEMEREGIRLDTTALADYSRQLEREIDQLRNRIFEAAGSEFNVDSPKQLGIVLYEDLQLEANPRKTRTGQYSTRESELLRLANRHQIVADVLDYRNAAKLKSTYVDQLPNWVDERTGRVHTHYSQAWTSTGRMQSNNPNLQTIPIRKARGKEIRAAFIARDADHSILSADYSQIELRIMAELSRDAGMIEAFTNGIDIHQATAAKVYKVDLEAVTREMRDKAKTVNFGILYGISAFGLQQRLNIPRTEASELIDNYFDKYPGVRTYIDQTIAFAKENGYVQTRSGRKRYLRDINSRNRTLQNAAERLAMNSPIQGTAADMLKLAMIRVHQTLQEGGFRSRLLLTVHDELVFDLWNEEQSTLLPIIETCMQDAMPMSVPIVVEMGVGANWLEAH